MELTLTRALAVEDGEEGGVEEGGALRVELGVGEGGVEGVRMEVEEGEGGGDCVVMGDAVMGEEGV